jgi:hypothetical protein
VDGTASRPLRSRRRTDMNPTIIVSICRFSNGKIYPTLLTLSCVESCFSLPCCSKTHKGSVESAKSGGIAHSPCAAGIGILSDG